MFEKVAAFSLLKTKVLWQVWPWLLVIFPFCSMAQQSTSPDSLAYISLDEITIQSFADLHSKNLRNIRRDPQVSTEKLLASIPGVSIISRGNFAQEPLIRGLGDGQINVTLNGMKIFGACTDRMDPGSSYIEPNNLKSIKVSFGPGMEAGGSTLGGAVNFELKEPEINAGKVWKTSVGTGYETNGNGWQGLASIQYSRRKFGIYLNGIYKKYGNYTPGGSKADLLKSFGTWAMETGFSVDSDARVLFSQFEKWNAGISAKYRLDEKNVLTADALIDRGKNIGYPALTMDVAFANAHIFSIGHQFKSDLQKLSLLDTKVYANYVDHAMDDTKRPAAQVPMHMDMPGQNLTAGFFSRGLFDLASKHKLSFKIEGFVNRWHAEMTMYPHYGGQPMFMLTIPDAQRTGIGAGLSDEWRVNNRLVITPGLRLDYYMSAIYSALGKNQLSGIYEGEPAVNDLLVSGSLEASYALSPHFRFTSKLARAARSSSLKELYAFYLFNRVDGFDYLGNPALSNESSVNTDASLKYSSTKLGVELKGFAYFFQNYIAGTMQPGFEVMTVGARGVKKFNNISSATIYGGELAASWQPHAVITLTSANTLQFGKDANRNFLPMISPFKSNHKVEWQPRKDWSLYAESLYASRQQNVSAFYGEIETTAYNLFNAGITREVTITNSKLICAITGLNLLNHYYSDHLDVIKLPRPGRSVQLRLTAYF